MNTIRALLLAAALAAGPVTVAAPADAAPSPAPAFTWVKHPRVWPVKHVRVHAWPVKHLRVQH